MKLSERRVTSLTPEATAAIAFAKGVAGAERRVLESVGEATIRGKVVSENTQKIANAILAKALLEGKLPPGAPGRPSNESVELKYVECAYRYFDLLDRRISHPAQKVADELHLEVRQVERCAKKYKWLIGYFEEDRDRFRAWRLGASANSPRSTADTFGCGRPIRLAACSCVSPRRFTALAICVASVILIFSLSVSAAADRSMPLISRFMCCSSVQPLC